MYEEKAWRQLLTKRLEKTLDGNYTRMLWAIFTKSRRQHPAKQQLYGHLPPITKTIQVRRTRHAEQSWRNEDELVSDVLQWTPSHRPAKAGPPARTYIQQFWFGLVSLFNGISTFVGYLMSKLFSLKNSSGTI